MRSIVVNPLATEPTEDHGMTSQIDPTDIALRLLLTLLAGGLLGLDRSFRGRAVGLRTTLLVTLAAALSMILANSLLDVAGRQSDAAVSYDVMRLPLGVLTGIGFIGAGAIFRNETLVVGVTTAATLWFATLVGLCLGAGATALGLTACALGVVILTATKKLENLMPKSRLATLEIRGDACLSGRAIREVLESFDAKVSSSAIMLDRDRNLQHLRFEIERPEASNYVEPPPFVQKVAELPHVTTLCWKAIMLPG